MSNPFEGERRARPRVEHPFLVTLRGVDAMGVSLGIETVLDNVSATGLFVRIDRPMELGASLAIALRLSVGGAPQEGARFAARGVIRRVELMEDGQYGIAVEFVRSRAF